MDLVRALGLGYLPKELPPAFSSRPLAAAYSQLRETRPDVETYPSKFSLARAGGLRRTTEIPNPFSQMSLTEHCAANWTRFRTIAAQSAISTSRPLIAKRDEPRALRHLGSPEKYERVRRSVGARFTLATDVSNFFPSIYTHAVDWAVRGKSAAKKDRRGRSVGATLDQLLRKSRGGQTVGVSVGPDTSWLISEMVLARVDERLQKRSPAVKEHALRWVDDMVFYAESQGAAEEALGFYEEGLSHFELALNPLKTSIVPGIRPYVDEWLIRLRQARYRDNSESHQADDIVDLFSLAFELHPRFPNSGVVSYAIKRCNPFPSGDAWKVYEELVLTSMTLESSSIRHAFDVLTYAAAIGLQLHTQLIETACNTLILRHAPLGHGYEVSWLLCLMRELGIEPSDDSIDAVFEMGCNVSNLLAWAAYRNSPYLQVTCKHPEDVISRAEAPDALQSEDWLLAYEARARKWCTAKGWRKTRAWKELGDAGVRFLDLPAVAPGQPPLRRIRRLAPAFVSTWGS